MKPPDSVQQPLRATKFCPNPAPYQAHPSATLPEVGPCFLLTLPLPAGSFLAMVACLWCNMLVRLQRHRTQRFCVAPCTDSLLHLLGCPDRMGRQSSWGQLVAPQAA